MPLGSFARASSAARRLDRSSPVGDRGYASTNPFKLWRKSYVLGRLKTSGPAILPKPCNRPCFVPRLTYRTPRSFSEPTIWFPTKCWLAHRWQTLERIRSQRLQSSSHVNSSSAARCRYRTNRTKKKGMRMCSKQRSSVLELVLELQQNASAEHNMRLLRRLSSIKERSVVTTIR